MGDNSEHMEVSAGDETETEYFQELTSFDNSLERSNDSLHGSLAIPTFSLVQSTELQGSQGFHVVGSQSGQLINTSCRSEELYTDTGTVLEKHSDSMSDYSEMICSSPIPNKTADKMMNPSGNLNFDRLVKAEANVYVLPNMFNVVNVTNSSDPYQFTVNNDSTCTRNVYTVGGITMRGDYVAGTSTSGTQDKQFEFRDKNKLGDLAETGSTSSDEKSGKCKMSPKRKGKKSRSSSSTGIEMITKMEPQAGPSPSRVDMTPESHNGEMGFRPSLLDEILSEKKLGTKRVMARIGSLAHHVVRGNNLINTIEFAKSLQALMRSPDVIGFLQSQQEKLVREKKITCGQSADS